MHLNHHASDLDGRTGRSAAAADVSCRKNQRAVIACNFLPAVALMFKLFLILFKCVYAFKRLCSAFLFNKMY